MRIPIWLVFDFYPPREANNLHEAGEPTGKGKVRVLLYIDGPNLNMVSPPCVGYSQNGYAELNL